jgi:hypothetical protein
LKDNSELRFSGFPQLNSEKLLRIRNWIAFVWFELNRKIVLPLIFMLVALLFSGVASASTEVGVSVGQSNEYTYSMSSTYRSELNGSLLASVPYTALYIENITIQEISGTNVTLHNARIYLADQTNETDLGWVDLSTGDGPASGYIILPDCDAGDLIYPNWEGEEQQLLYVYTINDTILMEDGDKTIEVNHANVTSAIYNQTANIDNTEFFNQTVTVDYYWEKSTGLLIRFTEYSVKEQGNVTETDYYQYQKVGLQQVFYPLIDSTDYPVTVDSNSAILGFAFNESERQISLYVSNVTENSGVCDVTVPTDLLWGTFSLNLDDSQVAEGVGYTQTSNSTYNVFHITYSGDGVHIINIVSSDTIPEFPSFALLLTLMAATLVAVILYRKKLQ